MTQIATWALVFLFVFANVVQARTVWSNEVWAVDKRDAQNDEDDYSCRIDGKAFSIFVSAEDGTASLELPILGGQGKVTTGEFSISVSFDNVSSVVLSANNIIEFGTTVASIPDLKAFVELFARSNVVEIEGAGARQKANLKGSRLAANAFRACLGTASNVSQKIENAEIYYGSRAGMVATVVGETGLNSGLAEIRIQHTRDNAKAFCEGYVLDTSEKCIQDTMADVKFPTDRVYGNCQTGEFVDMWNGRYRFEGKNHDPNVMADFRIRSLKDDTILDGSSASGYGTVMGVLKALCPARTSQEGWN